MYAIVEINGQQFKAEAGQKLFVHHIEGAENGSTVEFEKVLLVDKDGNVTRYTDYDDASVYQQVEQFLDDNLRDPDSYESIDWSPATETENGYYVRHKYRTRNGFGGMNIENKIFHLDKNGNVTGYTDY